MTEQIERFASLPYAQFQAEYAAKHRPVILTEVTSDWPARKWTPDDLATRFGERLVTINEFSDHAQQMPLRDYVQLVRGLPPLSGPWQWHAGVQADSPPYMRGVFLWEFSPELLAEIEILPYFLPNWLTRPSFRRVAPLGHYIWVDLFMGAPGASFPTFHFDRARTHNWFCQIFGTKHFWVASYDQARFLRDADGKIVDTFPPPADRYPEAHKAKIIEFDLHPGEMLFIPSGLWHTTKTHMLNISVSGNFVNRTNVDAVFSELKLREQPLKYLEAQAIAGVNRVFDAFEGEPQPVVWNLI